MIVTPHPLSEMAPSKLPNRIVVLGPSGAGKTTLALRLCELTGLPHVPLDALSREQGERAELGLFRDRVGQAMAAEKWIVDGQYPQVRDLVWQRAELAVWLDYSLPVTLMRVAKRRVRDASTQGPPTKQGFVAKQWDRVKRTLRCLEEQRQTPGQLGEFPNLKVIRLRDPRQAEVWLGNLVEGAD